MTPNPNVNGSNCVSRQQCQRIAGQADQRKCADAAEAVPLARDAVFLAFQPDQETQEEREENLDAFRRQHL